MVRKFVSVETFEMIRRFRKVSLTNGVTFRVASLRKLVSSVF
jgi:hypothetical protein